MTWKPGTPVRLTTRRFVIRSMMPADVTPEFMRWQRDPELRAGQNIHGKPRTREESLKIVQRADNRSRFILLIAATVAETPIGYFIAGLDRANQTSETTVVIGNRDWWGKNVVTEARARLLDFLFDEAGAEKVVGQPHSRNLASIFNYKSMGFTCEAVLRQQMKAAFGEGRLDKLIFGITKEEWLAQRGAEGQE